MLALNLTEKINQLKREISIWSKRHLTPLGKIVVVKIILLSKLNHLFSSLPAPTISLLKELSDIFFKFVWSNKPEKINRDVTILDYSMGGLKMTLGVLYSGYKGQVDKQTDQYILPMDKIIPTNNPAGFKMTYRFWA